MRFEKKHKLLLAILLSFGVFAQGLTMVRSGLIYDFDMGFWGPNGHDGVWHLALTNQVLKGFPPPHPTFSGQKLTNYHYFYDLLLALTNKLTKIPLHNLYFQIFPLFLAMGLGILSFLVGYSWRKDFWTGFWLAFFNYFAGSFGYLVTLWRHGQLGGESLFWSMQSISTLINPPFAFSLLVLLSGVFLLLRVKKWTASKVIGTSLLFGVLINIKAYAGVVGLSALLIYSLGKFFKKEKIYLLVSALAILISLLIFIPVNRGAGSLFVWKPFWFIHSMIESPDRLFLPRLAYARYLLIQQPIGLKLIAIEIFGLFLFLVGNLGTRVIGGWGIWSGVRKKKKDRFDLFLIAGAGSSLIPPLLFVQKGTAWNTIQFFYYFLFFVNFYAAVTMAKIVREKKWILLAGVIFLTIPTTISTLRGYWGWPPPTTISKGELAGLSFLKKEPPGVVLTYPYNEFEKKQYLKTPIPIKAYESTAYVAAFSGQQTFLEDQMNLSISGYDWQARRESVEKFFASEEGFRARGFLLNSRISYIYLPVRPLAGEPGWVDLAEGQKLPLTEEDLGIEKIFDNGEARVYQVHGIIEKE